MRTHVEVIHAFGVRHYTPDLKEVTLTEYKGFLGSDDGIELTCTSRNALEAINHLANLLGSGLALNGKYGCASPIPEFRFSYVPPYETSWKTFDSSGGDGKIAAAVRADTFTLEPSLQQAFETQFQQEYRTKILLPLQTTSPFVT